MKKRRGYIIAGIVVAVFSGIVGVRQYMNYLAQPLDEVEVTDSAEVDNIVRKYGIPVSDYQIQYGIVEPGQNLSVILRKHGLSLADVHRLTESAKGVFDVRKIREGQAYALFSTRDSLPQKAYFVYEENPKSYIVFDLREDYRVTRGENPVTWERKTVGGKVESSLWVAMQQSGTNPQLALDLSNIFGWSIDFFGLQKEDEFRVWYEQETVEGKELQNFHVLAASFAHGDSTYYAIPFVQDGEELYAFRPVSRTAVSIRYCAGTGLTMGLTMPLRKARPSMPSERER